MISKLWLYDYLTNNKGLNHMQTFFYAVPSIAEFWEMVKFAFFWSLAFGLCFLAILMVFVVWIAFTKNL
jgi:hypothetical protein